MVGFVGWQISKSRFIMVGVATDRSGEEIKTVATNLELSELAGIVRRTLSIREHTRIEHCYAPMARITCGRWLAHPKNFEV